MFNEALGRGEYHVSMADNKSLWLDVVITVTSQINYYFIIFEMLILYYTCQFSSLQ